MDIELHAIEKGEGPVLFLLHGNGSEAAYFAAQIPHFAQRYHVIALDTRGHGASPAGTAPFTISQFADDLADYMDAHGIEQAHILGFSDGGNIALVFALRHPDRALSLILNGANLFFDGLEPAIQDEIRADFERSHADEDHDPEAKHIADLQRLMMDEPNIDPEELARLAMPALVIVGDDDMVKHEHSELIARSLPHAELRVIKGTHFIAEECPEEFNSAVETFLDRAACTA